MSDSKAPPKSIPPQAPYRDMVQRLRMSPMSLEDLEKAAIEASLQSTDSNVAKASRLLGIGRTTFYRNMKKYGLR